MNLHERANFVRAMETIARAVNDEEVFGEWLAVGVADGDIDGTETDKELEYYCDDETFAGLMQTFLNLMEDASDGGLFVDGVLSDED